MKWLIGLLAVGLVIGTSAMVLGWARVAVVQDKVLSGIDKLLGETEVQRKTVQLALEKVQKSVDVLTEGKIKAQVEAERMGKKVEAQEEKLNELKGYLEGLREQLKSTQPVVIAGKTYPPEDLKARADKVIALHKSGSKELDSLKRCQANLETAAKSLAAKCDQAKEKVAQFENEVKEFDSKVAQLKTLKEARQAAGDSDKTLEVSFKELEKQIDAMNGTAEAGIRIEENRWKESSPQNDVAEIQQIVASAKGNEGTINEIDKILGKK